MRYTNKSGYGWIWDGGVGADAGGGLGWQWEGAKEGALWDTFFQCWHNWYRCSQTCEPISAQPRLRHSLSPPLRLFLLSFRRLAHPQWGGVNLWINSFSLQNCKFSQMSPCFQARARSYKQVSHTFPRMWTRDLYTDAQTDPCSLTLPTLLSPPPPVSYLTPSSVTCYF